MEDKDVIRIIKEVLDVVYSINFVEANLSRRHYDFSSQDYDFSFPLTVAASTSELSLKKLIENYLEHNSSVIVKNNHYTFNESGAIQEN